MVARRVFMQLKPNSVAEFTQRMEKEVLPILREQKGFQDEITFVSPGDTKAFAISLWGRREDADVYARETHPRIHRILAPFIDGAPRIATYEVVNSTFHKIGASVSV